MKTSTVNMKKSDTILKVSDFFISIEELNAFKYL